MYILIVVFILITIPPSEEHNSEKHKNEESHPQSFVVLGLFSEKDKPTMKLIKISEVDSIISGSHKINPKEAHFKNFMVIGNHGEIILVNISNIKNKQTVKDWEKDKITTIFSDFITYNSKNDTLLPFFSNIVHEQSTDTEFVSSISQETTIFMIIFISLFTTISGCALFMVILSGCLTPIFGFPSVAGSKVGYNNSILPRDNLLPRATKNAIVS